MTISIGCDHAGFPYKEAIIHLLTQRNIEIIDHGTYSTDAVDYPDFIHPVANDIEAGRSTLGILMCGSGNGVAMTANKHQGVRAAICWEVELATLARLHNDANAIAIPVRFVSENLALEMVAAFLDHEFEGGRHARRVGKIACG